MQIVDTMDRPKLLSLVKTWVLCIILLVFASYYGFSFERGDLNSIAGVDQQAISGGEGGRAVLIKAQTTLMYLLSLACILPSIKPVWNQIRRNLLTFSVLGWAALSVIWSDMPSTSAFNFLRMVINLVLVIYLFERYSANDIQKLMMLVGCLAAVGSLIMVVAFPQYGLQSRGVYALGAWEGIFGQKNLCGEVMLLLTLPAFFVKLSGGSARLLRVGYIVTLLFITAMTRSAGAWVASVLCLTFIALLKIITRMPGKDAGAVLLVVVGTLIAGGGLAYTNYDAIMHLLGKDPTMTGRTVLWEGLAHLAMAHPMCGYGYTAFWQGINGPSRTLALQMGWPGLAGAESGVMEMWLELGIVGMILYAAIFLRAIKDGIYCVGRGATPASLWYLSILFYVVSTNFEGNLLLTPSSLACILPFVAFVGLRREAQRIREAQPA